jgi:hypothetical protein
MEDVQNIAVSYGLIFSSQPYADKNSLAGQTCSAICTALSKEIKAMPQDLKHILALVYELKCLEEVVTKPSADINRLYAFLEIREVVRQVASSKGHLAKHKLLEEVLKSNVNPNAIQKLLLDNESELIAFKNDLLKNKEASKFEKELEATFAKLKY